MTFKSSRIWNGIFSLSLTKILIPDRIILQNGRVIVKKKRWLGLTGNRDEISFEHIASVRLRRGILSASVIIETSGGAKQDFRVDGFWRRSATRLSRAINEKSAAS